MRNQSALPYRSIAGALLFGVFFGPVGLLYASLLGGIVMTALLLVACGMAMAQHSPLPIATVWLLSIVWAMVGVRWYNWRLWKTMNKLAQHENQ